MTASQRTLSLIVAVLALPFILGTGLYFSGWRPAGTTNHGSLIAPPVALPALAPWPGKWSLLLIQDSPCDQACGARLDELRRLRISLAKDMERTRLAWMGSAIGGEINAQQTRIPDLIGLEGRPPPLGELPAGTVLLVDPKGMAMLRYAPGADAKGMRADLQRLLKYSWSG